VALGGGAGLVLAHLADVSLYGPYTAHLIGGTLLAIAVGPWLALTTMASVLALGALLWHDGGTSALGVNVLVMGVAGVLVGYGAYRAVLGLAVLVRRRPGGAPLWTRAGAAAVAAWVSVMASALTLGSLVAVGGLASLADVMEAPGATIGDLLPRYAAWGLLEAVLTGGIVAAVVAWQGSMARLEYATDIRRRVPVATPARESSVPAM
jgi:cobalt/nickel transport system permease protein